MTDRQLVANVMRTPDGTILQSFHVHDYQEHVDANGKLYMVDGGISYIRRSWYEEGNGEDLSVYADDPHVKIREWFNWGTYGKEGKGPLKWVKLKNLSTNHIQRIVDEGYARSYIRKIFDDELAIRKNKPLAIIVNYKEFATIYYSENLEVVKGFCIQHEGRPDLLNQWVTSSNIVSKISDNTYETMNSIYNVIEPEEVKNENTSAS